MTELDPRVDRCFSQSFAELREQAMAAAGIHCKRCRKDTLHAVTGRARARCAVCGKRHGLRVAYVRGILMEVK